MHGWELFDLNFSNSGLVLLCLIPVLINLGILAFVIFALPKGATNSTFSAFVFILSMWQVADGFMKLSSSPVTALHWARISEAAILFVLPSAFLFGIRFVKWYKRISPPLLFCLLFLIPILLEFGIIAGMDGIGIIPSVNWNWIANPMSTGFMYAIYLWLSLCSVACIVLFWLIYFKTGKAEAHKAPSLLLAIGFSIPALGGICFEAIGPFLLHVDDIPVTAPLVTVFSLLAFLAITRYKLLDFSPRHQWEKIVDLTQEGILIVNNQDQVMYANDCFCQMMGYAFEEIAGKKGKELFLDGPDWGTIDKALVERQRGVSGKTEFRMRTKSGEKLWILLSGSPYTNSRGEVIGSIGLHTNITELKKAEERLEKKVHELNSFFYRASHDLKSPAVSIKGLVSLNFLSTEEEKTFISEGIELSLTRLLKTTERLSEIAIISQRKLEMTAIDWEQKIHRVIEEHCLKNGICVCQPLIQMKEAFYSDRFLIDMILKIALSNSIAFRDPNKEVCEIEVSVSPVKEGAVIRIKDNGSGIPKEIKDKIFTLFLKGSDKAGTGLGLYTLNAAVEKLGGEVSVSSTVGIGTEMSIFLPQGMPQPILSAERPAS